MWMLKREKQRLMAPSSQSVATGLGPAAAVVDQQQSVVAGVALLDGQGNGTGLSGVNTWIQRFPGI